MHDGEAGRVIKSFEMLQSCQVVHAVLYLTTVVITTSCYHLQLIKQKGSWDFHFSAQLYSFCWLTCCHPFPSPLVCCTAFDTEVLPQHWCRNHLPQNQHAQQALLLIISKDRAGPLVYFHPDLPACIRSGWYSLLWYASWSLRKWRPSQHAEGSQVWNSVPVCSPPFWDPNSLQSQ